MTGVHDAETARRLTRAVISVLLEQLSVTDRAWLLSLLPNELVGTTTPMHLTQRPADGLRDFIDRVAAREGLDPGTAREHTQSVCSALAEPLVDEERTRLLARLPDPLTVLFALPLTSATHAPRVARSSSRPRRTLSEGRPNSGKPLSEAALPDGQQHSLARNGNPHADTKLSTAAGTTQEREDETLSRGRRGR